MTDFTYQSAAELAPKIQSGETSPVELARHFLDRIAAQDESINAFITVTEDVAMRQAEQAEKEIAAGNYKGPLHGIPIGIKDTYQTKGVLSTSGSALFQDFVPEESSTVVTKLLDDAGAVMVGKLNMHTLGPGSAGFNPTFGHTRSPWNLNHIVGGSSSGSGAALAAGMVPVVTGTDMWGSLRVPAAMTGVYGFKPSAGLASATANIPTSATLDQTGPMARSVTDLALMLNAIAGYDPQDPTSVDVTIPDYTVDLDAGIVGIKIGIPSYYRSGLDPEVERLFTESIDKLTNLGASVHDIEIPELNMAKYAGLVTALSESGANYLDSLQTQPEAHAQDVRALLMAGSVVSGTHYVRAQQARRKLARAFQEAFHQVDVVLGPTIPMQTPAFEEHWEMQALDVVEKVLPFTVPANLAGIPALSVPMGLDNSGLPTGMQFFGRNFTEQQLLRVARAWETTDPISYGEQVATA